jgi:hypothetical protein
MSASLFDLIGFAGFFSERHKTGGATAYAGVLKGRRPDFNCLLQIIIRFGKPNPFKSVGSDADRTRNLRRDRRTQGVPAFRSFGCFWKAAQNMNLPTCLGFANRDLFLDISNRLF